MSAAMRRPLRFLLPMLLLCAAALQAQDAPDPAALDFGKLRSQQQALRPQIESAQGPYADMPRKRRDALLARQTELLALIDGKQGLSELNPEQQVAMQNALQALTDAESDAGSDRQVCKRVKTTGSHRISTSCRTRKQLKDEAENTRSGMERVRSACSGQPNDGVVGAGACTGL